MSNLQQIRESATPIALQVRWSDLDTNGHVNNARIVSLFEEARIRAREKWRAGGSDPLNGQLLVRAQTTSFDNEVLYGPDTSILVWVTRIGNSSYVVGQLLLQDEQPCVYMEVTMVVVDSQTGKPTRHSTAFQQHLSTYAGPRYDPHGGGSSADEGR